MFDSESTHLRRARNFTIENQFSSEDFLAKRHWRFSPDFRDENPIS
jgi:hypothetical protein